MSSALPAGLSAAETARQVALRAVVGCHVSHSSAVIIGIPNPDLGNLSRAKADARVLFPNYSLRSLLYNGVCRGMPRRVPNRVMVPSYLLDFPGETPPSLARSATVLPRHSVARVTGWECPSKMQRYSCPWLRRGLPGRSGLANQPSLWKTAAR